MGFNLAILISGNGSNMLNILEACEKNILSSNVKVVITNNKNSKGIQAAKKKTKVFVINEVEMTKFETELNKVLITEKVNFICLAGFMKMLSKKFVNNWNKKIINIHPSLLPSFPGLNPVKQALDKGVKYTGCTIHFVDEGMDTGQIIDQRVIKVKRAISLEKLTKKILKEEHILFIKVLLYLEKEFLNDKN
jgi:phosphoribosylglycinamide formyltransferase-1